MEVVLFDNTMREMESIVASSVNENKVIPDKSFDMYIDIEELWWMIEEEKMVKVHPNYKTMDKKVSVCSLAR